jgi:hypothetical protein
MLASACCLVLDLTAIISDVPPSWSCLSTALHPTGLNTSCPFVKRVGDQWQRIADADAVAELITPVITIAQATATQQGVVLDLSSLTFPLVCLMPPGEGGPTQNEAVFFRDSQRAVGFPVGYAPPSLTTAAVSSVSFAETTSTVAMCGSDVAFEPAISVASQLRPLVVQTVGTRVTLTGTNFGFHPVVTAGLSAEPAHVCSSNHTFIDFIVTSGEGTGLLYTAAGGNSAQCFFLRTPTHRSSAV